MRALTPLVALAGLVGSATSAPAKEWRYCYGLVGTSHKFYTSHPFPAAQSAQAIEADFQRYLVQSGISGAHTGCPLGPDRHALEGRIAYADKYQRDDGNTPVHLDWPADEPVAAY